MTTADTSYSRLVGPEGQNVSTVRKSEQVRSLFGCPDWYLKRRHNIRVRAETIQEFLKSESFRRILDIGCGDGSLSLPLLAKDRRLTLLDFSEGMLAVARSRVPEELAGSVEICHEDFMSAAFKGLNYDVIICVGVLAHADDPSALITKIISLLRPGGNLILEQTDSSNLMTGIVRIAEWPKHLFVPEKYVRNQLSSANLLRTVAEYGLNLVGSFRYALPLPGMHRLISQEGLYRLIRFAFGAYPHARLSSLGNECLYHFKSVGASREGRPAFCGLD